MEPGERLRFERVQKKLSAAEAARRLHISEDLLAAIETDETGHLAPVYRRGYLVAYARILGIPQDELAELLARVQPADPNLEPVFQQGGRRQGADRWLRATSYALASLLVGTLAWQFTYEAVRLSQGKDPLKPNSGQQTAGEVATVNGDGGEEHINASLASLERIGHTDAGRGASAGEQAWAALERGSDNPEPLAIGEHHLDIRASADSWVEISDARGRLLEQDLLRGGSSRHYRGFSPFKITLGRSSAIELFLDGQVVDLQPFTRDEVAQMMLAAGSAAKAQE